MKRIIITGLTPALHVIVQPLLFKAGYQWLLGGSIQAQHIGEGEIVADSGGFIYRKPAASGDVTINLSTEPLTKLIDALSPVFKTESGEEITLQSDGSLEVAGHRVTKEQFEEIERRADAKPIKIGDHVVWINRKVNTAELSSLEVGCQRVSAATFAALRKAR